MLKKITFIVALVSLFVVLSAFVGAVQSQTDELPALIDPGPYGVRLKAFHFVDPNREDWTLDTYVWYPADKTNGTPFMAGSLVLKDAPPDRSGAPYPLIIYSHTYTSSGSELSQVTEQLASYGYVVAAPHHHDTEPTQFELVDRPLDILLVLNELAAIREGDLAGMIDTNNVGLIGYSQGGDAILQMLGLLRDPANFRNWCAEHPELKSMDCTTPASVGNLDFFDAIAAYRTQLGLQNLADGRWTPFGDQRIRAVLALDPCDFPLTSEDMLAAVTTPTMILHGAPDALCDYEGNAVRTFTHLSTDDRYLITLVKGDHAFYLNDQRPPQHFATAFFGRYLQGDETYAPYLTPEHLPTWPHIQLVWGPYAGE